jgi:hypothetical protein
MDSQGHCLCFSHFAVFLNWQFPRHLRQHSWKGFSSSSPMSFTRAHTFEVPLLDDRVYSSLACLRLKKLLGLKFVSGDTCRNASCCWLGWAPAAFEVGHVRGDVYVGKVKMHGVTKRPFYVFVLILYASDVSQLRTALRNQLFTVPCQASRRRGRVPREASRGHVPRPVYPSPCPQTAI